MGALTPAGRGAAGYMSAAQDRLLASLEPLSEEEKRGLRANFAQLFEIAVALGVDARPLREWSEQELTVFLSAAIRAAVPLRTITEGRGFLTANFDDEIPF